jgi:hypothetical protein
MVSDPVIQWIPMVPRFLSCRLAAAGLGAGLLIVGLASSTPSAPGGGDPVQRFLAHPDEKLTQYKAKRHLKARNERFNKEAWLDALTELDPGQGFRYTVLAEDGSGLIRNRVLHRALEAEQQALSQGEVGRSAISPANYQISFGTHDETANLDRLRIVPLRKEQMLVDGTISVVATDGELVRIEGRLAKTPSFWTNRVDIVRRYGRVEGVHVPLSIESTANLKIVGDSVFSMTYEYESVNGKAVTKTESKPGSKPDSTPLMKP